MFQRLSVTDQRQTATKRIVVCCGCVGLSFLAIAWFGLHERLQAAENTVPDHQVHATPTKIQPNLVASYGKLPLSFEANRGQTDARVRFLARGGGYTIFLTADEAVLALEKSSVVSGQSSVAGNRLSSVVSRPLAGILRSSQQTTDNGPRTTESVLRMKLVGANASAAVTGADELPGRTNYFIGSDPKNWHTRVPNYARVKYANVYPGVDQVYYGNQSQLESDFIVAPGADPSAITLEIRGARRIRLDAQGSLILSTRSGEMRLLKPVLYQPASGAANGRTEITGSFVLRGPRRVGFAPGPYDRMRPLVIDPVMSFLAYFAGNGTDVIRAVALDQQGNMYVTGWTSSNTDVFPPGVQGYGCDNYLYCEYGTAFVFKISFSGTLGKNPQLAYWDFFIVGLMGGRAAPPPPPAEIGAGIAVDSQGNAYVAGLAAPTLFPNVNQCQGCNPDSSSFVAELDPKGNILFATTFAGFGSQITGLALDSASPPHIFVGGTLSGDALTPNTPTGFTPTKNAFQQSGPAQSSGLTTGFVAELGTGTSCPSSAADCLLYATFFGGTKSASVAPVNKVPQPAGDLINGIAVDSLGLVYITGTTSTNDFPVSSNGYSQTTCLTTETCTLAFLAKLDPTAGASGLLYSTTLGLPSTTHAVQYIGNAVAVAKDGPGYAYITGTTGNQILGVVGQNDLNNGGWFFPTTSGAVGTPQNGSCVALNKGGETCPGSFVSVINTNASGSSSLAASTYLGGVNYGEELTPTGALTFANAIAVDAAGNAFVAGGTDSSDFPLRNVGISSTAIQNALPALLLEGQSIFLAVLPSGLSSILYSTYLGGSGLAYPATIGNISYNGGGSESASDLANAIALDSSGNAYIAGQETSANFYIAPTAGVYGLGDDEYEVGGTHGWAEIVGTGITPPATHSNVSLSPAGGINFGKVGLSGTGSAQITAQNTGTAALNISSITIVPDSGTPARTFFEYDNCQGWSIGISATCTISVTFTPGAIGAYGATLELADNTPSGTQTARLTGAGVAPFPEVAFTLIQNGTSSTNFNNTVQFGTIQQGGSSSTATIRLENSGTAALVMGSLSVVSKVGNVSDVSEANTCSKTTIQVSSSCQINVTFTPSSTPGTQESFALAIPDNAPGAPQNIALLATSGTPPPPPASLPVLASVNDYVPRVPANSGTTTVHSAASSGGQYVAFESAATNLPGPQTSTEGFDSIFLRKICLRANGCTPVTKFISYGPTSGPNANNGAACNLNTAYLGSRQPAIDSTGQFVAFLSDACVPGAYEGAIPVTQIYLRNVASNSTSLISLNDSGNALNNGVSAYSMSANARYFAYSSSSANVAGVTTNWVSEIYLRDANCTFQEAQKKTCALTTLISQEPNGKPAASGATTEQPFISPDGRYVVFSSSDESLATHPPASFAANAPVVYLRDTCNGASGSCTPTTAAISVDSTGMAVSGGEGAAVANGGRFIIFSSFACSLLPSGCTGGSPEEVYLADTCTYKGVPVPSCLAAPPKLISKDQNGQPDGFLSDTVGPPSISADGRLAMFTSYNPLLPNVGAQAIYAYDTCTSNGTAVANCTTALHAVSVDSSGNAFGNGSDFASIDATAQYVSFGTGGDPVTTQNPTPMSGGVYLGLASGFAGSAALVVNLSPASLAFPPQAVGTSSSAQSVTLKNTGSAGLTITSIKASGDFSQTNTCGSSLAASASCTLSVTFKPTATGPRTGAVTITDSASPATQTVSLTGTGDPSVVSLSPASLTFPAQPVGTSSSTQSVTLKNTGSAGLTITSIKASGDFSQKSACGSSLAASGSCTIKVTFSPTATGTLTGTLTITDNSNGVTGSTQAVSLSGTGTAPVVSLSPASLTFPAQAVGTSSSAQSVTLKNTGSAGLTITSIRVSGDFSQTNTCGSSVAASASCTVSVTFKPTATGTRTGAVTITDNASPATQTVSLTGTGDPSVVSLSPASLTFPAQPVGTSSSTQSVTLKNTGSASLSITSITVSGDFSRTKTCGSSLAASGSCTINVTFSPTATGPLTGTLTITDNSNGVAGSTQTVSLSGTGTAPLVSLSAPSLSFSNQPINTTSAAQAEIVTNTGTANLTISTVTIGGTNASDFAKGADACTGATVTPNKTCAVSVKFAPSATGSRSASLSFTDNASNSPQTVSLTGTGVNPVPTLSKLSPSSATASGGTFTLTVTGTNFVSTSTVQWKGKGLTTKYVSDTKLTASVPASDIAAAGTVSVTVMNPTPGGGTSNGLTFTIN